MIANPMTAKETFESFYRRKLDALKIELNKESMMGDWSFVPDPGYACYTCKGRISLHTMEGQFYCLLCQKPPYWTREIRARVDSILESYPSVEESMKEWQALQNVPTPREVRSKARVRAGDVELGKRIRAAREKANLSQVDLARQLVKKNGRRFTLSSIQGYECGEAKPTAYVMEQLRDILGLEG